MHQLTMSKVTLCVRLFCGVPCQNINKGQAGLTTDWELWMMDWQDIGICGFNAGNFDRPCVIKVPFLNHSEDLSFF